VGGWSDDDLPELAGRVAVVTGGNAGLGFETARALAAHGAHVVLAARDPGRGAAAVDRIRAETGADRVERGLLDLADLASVRRFAAEVTARHERLDVLVNNAAAIILPRRQLTADGFEAHFGINHLGHFALTGLLLPALRRSAGAGRPARVVTVTSMMYRNARLDFDDLQGEDYRPARAYGRSKLANVLFAHPGYARTTPTGATLTDLATRLFAQPARAGAWPLLYAATRPELPGAAFVGPGHLFGMRGSPARATLAAVADDATAAARLWSESERLTGVRYAFTPAPKTGS
jgi:NAD(P)-dependent dehydrogenase (short-subunit alcohol dehydrogenase family)